MSTDDMEIVSALCAKLADMVGTERYELWFGASVRLALDGDSLMVCVPNRFYQDFIRLNFRAELATACQAIVGRSLELQFSMSAAVADGPAPDCPPLAGGDAGRRCRQLIARSQDERFEIAKRLPRC